MTREELYKQIKDHPELHRHKTFNDLQRCCFIDGAIDAYALELHEQISNRRNGGRLCDVEEGPCSCGAWH